MSNRFREIRQVLHLAERAGCRVELTRGGHYRILCPSGALLFCSATPSDNRSIKNLKAHLRREGIRV